MKNLIGVLFVFFVLNGFGQVQQAVPDTLVKLGGKKLLVIIKNITTTTVYYSLIEKPNETIKAERKDLEKAILKNGRVEIFNKPAFEIIKEGEWETVLVTNNKKDVEGLYKRKEITARSSPTKSKKKAKENAIIKLQKMAANTGGSIVLITHTESIGGFDENPGYIIDGIAYGPEPPEEGTNVVEDPAKKSTQTKGTSSKEKTTDQKNTQQKAGTGNQQKSNTSAQDKKK
jgi:hypothetical protein